MIQHYEEITWDDTDIVACKQACEILLSSGVSPSELLESNSFGNLDVSAVIAENYTEPEIVF